MKQQVKSSIDYLSNNLRTMQSNDGSWRFCFEGGPVTDAYMIILLRSLEYNDEWLIQKLVERLLKTQDKNGTWKIFHDEKEGNLSAAVEAYYGLLFSGYVDKSSSTMQQAKRFINEQGGLTNTNSLTKTMLALTGQIPWPKHLQLPIESILLPPSAPINFYEFVGYTRVHIAPILITSNLNYQYKTIRTPDLSDLINDRFPNDIEFNSENTRFILSTIKKEINKLLELPQNIRKLAITKAEQYMLERIEPDGTLYSYFGATFNMIFALLALGYPKDHYLIKGAITGLNNLLCLSNKTYLIEYSTSTVWDTSLTSFALQNAGVDESDDMIQLASEYLLSRQQIKFGDWALNNQNTLPGGWGFSDINTIQPDVDDTAASLRALKKTILHQPQFKESWSLGLNWVLSMQNNDGGWAAFEKNIDNKLISLLPFDAASRTLIDPSTIDLTGRTLEFLGDDANLRLPHPQVEKASQWLLANQEKDGSWYGRWGICYIYGTWSAIKGLIACGTRSTHPSIIKGVEWLLSIQNDDGGWGESCYSDLEKKYIPLNASTPSQTAWALDALITAHDQPIEAIDKGISNLITSIDKDKWTKEYPTGGAFQGIFIFVIIVITTFGLCSL
ncbi:terpene cyclase/mutase family protein [Bacillus sp. FJAT-45350]|uniref:terpene cyclase/mutase family protein n=1 Tax=Bacillus sp. FJAT-45350 TaxID=2011014 RepID=UPI0027B96E32|nr:prenyltransferase/squalene oxidase repeat-containing protein [Bacillus sp. FJAT-45350]